MLIGFYFLGAFLGACLANGIMQLQSNLPHSDAHTIKKAEKQSLKKESHTISSTNKSLDLVKDATAHIKKVIKEDKKSAPYLVTCTYKLHQNQVLSSLTEAHFSAYRQKPKYEQVFFTKEPKQADHTVTVIYKRSHKRYLTKVTSNAKEEVLEVKQIRFAPKTHII